MTVVSFAIPERASSSENDEESKLKRAWNMTRVISSDIHIRFNKTHFAIAQMFSNPLSIYENFRMSVIQDNDSLFDANTVCRTRWTKVVETENSVNPSSGWSTAKGKGEFKWIVRNCNPSSIGILAVRLCTRRGNSIKNTDKSRIAVSPPYPRTSQTWIFHHLGL